MLMFVFLTSFMVVLANTFLGAMHNKFDAKKLGQKRSGLFLAVSEAVNKNQSRIHYTFDLIHALQPVPGIQKSHYDPTGYSVLIRKGRKMHVILVSVLPLVISNPQR